MFRCIRFYSIFFLLSRIYIQISCVTKYYDFFSTNFIFGYTFFKKSSGKYLSKTLSIVFDAGIPLYLSVRLSTAIADNVKLKTIKIINIHVIKKPCLLFIFRIKLQ